LATETQQEVKQIIMKDLKVGMGSLLCGFSGSGIELLIFRVIQAVGGSLLISIGLAMAIISTTMTSQPKWDSE
jgi:MFS family permease